MSLFSFYKIRELEGGTGLAQGKCWYQWDRTGDRERKKENEYSTNTLYTCI
jgi:hypothetical protein